MSKWEDKYNELSPKIDDMIKEQSSKINEISREKAKIVNDVNSKEYRKLRDELNSARKEKQRLEKLKPNLGQIANIIEYRDDLKKQLNKLKAETKTREDFLQATKQQVRLENKIEEYQEKYEEIGKEIKEVNRKLKEDLSPEEKKEQEEKLSKLQAKREKIKDEMPKAQDELNKQEEVLKLGLGRKTSLSGLSQEEIDEKSFDIQNKISKCNFVARNLLEGLSWDSIDMNLDNWKDKRFKEKDGRLSKDIEHSKDGTRKDGEEASNEKQEENPENLEAELGDNGINPELPAPKNTFADRHPRLAKIGRFFKNIFSKSRKSNVEIEKTAEELQDEIRNKQIDEAIDKNNEEKAMQKGTKAQEELSFKEYIKQIAEKGMTEVEKEQREARQKEAREKLAKMREANRKVEENKFGKPYADMSRTDDGSR